MREVAADPALFLVGLPGRFGRTRVLIAEFDAVVGEGCRVTVRLPAPAPIQKSASAPGTAVYKNFNITADAVVEAAKGLK